MKNIAECKEFFKDLHMDCLSENAFEKSAFDSTEKAKYEMFCETLKFVYGQEFERVRPLWTQESLNEFYSHQTA